MQILGDRHFLEGEFLRRPNRFLVHCRRGDAVVRAHLPNPGRLRELLLPGSRVLLQRHAGDPGRKTRYTAVAVMKEGRPVFLHTGLTNAAAARLLAAGLVPGLEEYRVERREVTVGPSRFDFLLRAGKASLLLEVKSCTLFGKRIAMFPDAVTVRGRRHLVELAELAGGGRRTGVLFIVHRPQARFFLPEYHTDPHFAATLAEVRTRVKVKAVAVAWRRDLTLSPKTREVHIPWEVLAREGRDGGAYLVVLRHRRGKKIAVGKLGRIHFPAGYYVYAGSALTGLARRVERHRRRRKTLRWHIDYLRNETELCGVFPVRTADRLECGMAAALRRITSGEVPNFGSSDCVCPSHLFVSEKDPLADPAFMRLLLHFRIDRLLEGPCAPFFPGAGSGREGEKVLC